MNNFQGKCFVISLLLHGVLFVGSGIISSFHTKNQSALNNFYNIPMDVTVVGETTTTTALPEAPKEDTSLLSQKISSFPEEEIADKKSDEKNVQAQLDADKNLPDPESTSLEETKNFPFQESVVPENRGEILEKEQPQDALEKSEKIPESSNENVKSDFSENVQQTQEKSKEEELKAFQDILSPLVKKEEEKKNKKDQKSKIVSKAKKDQSVKKNKKKKSKKKGKHSSMESLLKDLEKKESSAVSRDGPTSPDGRDLPLGATLSISEIDLVRRLLYRHWHLPPGAYSSGEKLSIVVQLELNPDGTVSQAKVLYNKSTTQHPFFQVAAESALRAIYHPDCQPLPLPADRYRVWKNMEIRFSPQH